MKAVKLVQNFMLVVTFGLILAGGVFAQGETDVKEPEKEPEKIAQADPSKDPAGTKTAEKDNANQDDDDDVKEAEKIGQYYNNYLAEYRLGPNDIVSIEVFGQCPDYCRTDALVPPTARMSYPLIREGIFVGGKTVEEVADDVTKRLEEYIIDPKVTVTLVRPGSARYAVMGKVNSPGVRIMDRKISINEAIMDAGGIAKDGSKKKVFIARVSPEGFYSTEEVDLVGIEEGKIPTMFLKPGDQVFVGDKGLTFGKVLETIGKMSALRILFGSPF